MECLCRVFWHLKAVVTQINKNILEVSGMFNNQVLMITRGTGSFGNAVLRRFLESDLREIRILSRDEKKRLNVVVNPGVPDLNVQQAE